MCCAWTAAGLGQQLGAGLGVWGFGRIIDRGGHYSEADAAAIIKAMLSVISHIHALGVVHRDLKVKKTLVYTAAAATHQQKLLVLVL